VKLYTVGVRELHIRYIDVQAESEDEARDLAQDAACANIGTADLQYIEDLNKSTWDVLEVENDTA